MAPGDAAWLALRGDRPGAEAGFMDKPGYEDTLRQLAARRLEAFVTAVPHPHLAITVHQGIRATSVGTIRLLPGDSGRTTKAVVPVSKRTASNPFEHMITLGRAPNNDLVIPDQRVSKFHAYFRKLGQQWMINDANSMNGTWVDGQPIPSDRSAPLKSGSTIRLAETLEMIFLEPDGLFARVQEA